MLGTFFLSTPNARRGVTIKRQNLYYFSVLRNRVKIKKFSRADSVILEQTDQAASQRQTSFLLLVFS